MRPDGTLSAVVAAHLARFDARLFGGTAIGLSVAAIEAVTERDALWVTTQFVSSAQTGTALQIVAEVLASGRKVSQVRLTGTADSGRIVFTALGAAADIEGADDAAAAQAHVMPVVASPADSVPILLPSDFGDVGWHTEFDARLGAAGAGERAGIWLRFRDGSPITSARLAFVADLVPLVVARMCGTNSGVSLDNTIRIIRPVDTEWVLVDIHAHGAFRGYGTGTALLWSQDGTLLASASQTSSIFAQGSDFFARAVATLSAR
jgi:acyl-CoA thioesterase